MPCTLSLIEKDNSMKPIQIPLIVLTVLFLLNGFCDAETLDTHTPTDAHNQWRLGVQAYTFRKFTLCEAIDKTAELGLNWMEIYPGQKLSQENPTPFNHYSSAEDRKQVRDKMARHNIRLVSYGVVGLLNDETECRKVFEFAREMGAECIASEPPAQAIDLIDRLAQEYKIAVAFHNHPRRTDRPDYIYWNPDEVMKLLEGRSKWLGLCADTGHWTRSGIKPLNAVRQTHHGIKYFHLKDLNEFGKHKAHDVVWGTGKSGINDCLKFLDKTGWQGYFSIEYEHNWDNSIPEIRKCVAHFNDMARKLDDSGWRHLFNDKLSNARLRRDSWTIEDQVLTRHGGGYIWSQEQYGDFILDLEFKISPKGNSGIFFRAGSLNDYVQNSLELQIHDQGDGHHYGQCGAIYNCLPPKVEMGPMAGGWHHVTIKAREPMVYAVIDGKIIIEMNLDDWNEPHKNPDGTRNKFNKALKDMPRRGHIGFQDHGDPVWFRNIKIKSLEKTKKLR